MSETAVYALAAALTVVNLVLALVTRRSRSRRLTLLIGSLSVLALGGFLYIILTRR